MNRNNWHRMGHAMVDSLSPSFETISSHYAQRILYFSFSASTVGQSVCSVWMSCQQLLSAVFSWMFTQISLDYFDTEENFRHNSDFHLHWLRERLDPLGLRLHYCDSWCNVYWQHGGLSEAKLHKLEGGQTWLSTPWSKLKRFSFCMPLIPFTCFFCCILKFWSY